MLVERHILPVSEACATKYDVYLQVRIKCTYNLSFYVMYVIWWITRLACFEGMCYQL